MLVKDVCEKDSDFVDRVLDTDSVEKVIAVMGEHKQTRTVFVVDKAGLLKGAISIHELFKLFFDEMKPKILNFSKKKKDLIARDIMRDVVSVSLDDNLDDALRAAASCRLQDLPVCVDGKIVAELDCFEILYGMISK